MHNVLWKCYTGMDSHSPWGYGTEKSHLQGHAEAAGQGSTFDHHGYTSTSPSGLLVMSQTDTLCMLLEYNHV